MTDLTIAIVSFNAKVELRACLDSVFASTRLASLEVIVADNASSDGTVDMLRGDFPQVRVIESPENLGFGRACNLCWRQAKSSLILFLNSDTRVPDGALDRLVATRGSRRRSVHRLLRTTEYNHSELPSQANHRALTCGNPVADTVATRQVRCSVRNSSSSPGVIMIFRPRR